jgi:hypothetical protein
LSSGKAVFFCKGFRNSFIYVSLNSPKAQAFLFQRPFSFAGSTEEKRFCPEGGANTGNGFSEPALPRWIPP